uniref:Capsid protein n=1 Tax=Beihai noda-like virus 10 TaxID=1922463 RepID=A0A1L3KFW0_9VIRU|nr:hypothetical protein 2 [Beihai noda-like virus 10]
MATRSNQTRRRRGRRNRGGQPSGSLPLPPQPTVLTGPRYRSVMGGIVIHHRILAKTVNVTPSKAGAAQGAGEQIKICAEPNGLLQSGWLGNQVKLFDKYRFTQMRLIWQPATSLMFAGNVAVWYDPDPSPTKPASYSSASGHYRVLTLHVAAQGEITVEPHQLKRLTWYTAQPVSDYSDNQGVIEIAWSDILSSSIQAATAFTLGHLWIEFQLELSNPSG